MKKERDCEDAGLQAGVIMEGRMIVGQRCEAIMDFGLGTK